MWIVPGAKRQTCDRLNVPVSGFVFLAEEVPPTSFIIQHNTLGNSGIIGINNYLNKCDDACYSKISGLLEKVEHALLELSTKVDSLEKKIDSLPDHNNRKADVSVKLQKTDKILKFISGIAGKQT